jgi:hypothetical protein
MRAYLLPGKPAATCLTVYQRSRAKSGITAPQARVTPGWFFCGQSRVHSCRKSVNLALRPRSSTEPRDVIAALPAACRALDPQHIEAADQTADCAIEGHGIRSHV